MTIYQYLTTQLSGAQLQTLIRGGVISARIPTYIAIYEFWRCHHKSETETAREFKQSRSNIGYVIRQMKRTIN